MSSNADLARSAFEAWSRGDIEGTLATMDPGVEWHLAFQLPDLPPDKTVYRGHDEVRELWNGFRAVWNELTLSLEEVLHDEDDVLLIRARFHGRGSGSGVEVERVLYYVLEIVDSELVRIRPFDELADARSAAGMPDG